MSGKVALAVAPSGIAATLDNGRTAHSRFKLPLNLTGNTDPTCNIGKSTGLADLMRATSLIVWDEVSMSHKRALEAVDKSLRDLRNCPDKLFGGVPVLLCGDMRQILPVVPGGTPADELRSSIKASRLWRHVHTIR